MASTRPVPVTDHDAYIEMVMSWGRPEILRLIRRMGIKAGSIKDTRELAEALWRITAANRRLAEGR
jgi:hypothetical protein